MRRGAVATGESVDAYDRVLAASVPLRGDGRQRGALVGIECKRIDIEQNVRPRPHRCVGRRARHVRGRCRHLAHALNLRPGREARHAKQARGRGASHRSLQAVYGRDRRACMRMSKCLGRHAPRRAFRGPRRGGTCRCSAAIALMRLDSRSGQPFLQPSWFTNRSASVMDMNLPPRTRHRAYGSPRVGRRRCCLHCHVRSLRRQPVFAVRRVRDSTASTRARSDPIPSRSLLQKPAAAPPAARRASRPLQKERPLAAIRTGSTGMRRRCRWLAAPRRLEPGSIRHCQRPCSGTR
jgi:hypothetical protein